MSVYEEPTNELRQVKTPIKEHVSGEVLAGTPPAVLPGYYRIIGYDVTIQRKWRVDEGEPVLEPYNMLIEPEGKRFLRGEGPLRGFMQESAYYQPYRIEWRDLPTVDSKDAP